MPTVAASDSELLLTPEDLVALSRPRKSWGPWKFQRSGLKHTRMDYLISWDRLNSSQALWKTVLHMNGKNTAIYGKDCVPALVEALTDVLGHQRCERPSDQRFNADKLAGVYWDRLKNHPLEPYYADRTPD